MRSRNDEEWPHGAVEKMTKMRMTHLWSEAGWCRMERRLRGKLRDDLGECGGGWYLTLSLPLLSRLLFPTLSLSRSPPPPLC